MEENLIKIIEDKVRNLQETKLEKIEEMIKEQKLDVAYEKLTKYKEDALVEIESNGDGSKEATEDLKKIETELEKCKIAELEIKKEVEEEISDAKKDSLYVKAIINEKEMAQKDKEKADKAIEKLLKYKDEALSEIKDNGAESEMAKEDLKKIELELEEKIKIKEENEKIIEQSDEKINEFIEKYDFKNVLEEQLNKDWEDAIKENEEFDKRKAEEQLNEDWDAAIKENEEFDRRKQNEIAWNKAIKEYEELERKTNEQGENSVRRTYQQGSGNRGSVSNSLEKVKITLMVDKNKVDIDEAGDLFYKEARNNGKKLRNELDKNNLFYKDKKGMKNIDYALLYAIKEVNSDLVQDYLNVIKGKAVGKDRYEESKKRLTEALDIEYKFDEGRGLFRGFKEKRVARNAKKLGIASLEGISEKSVLDKIKESFNKFKNINLLKGKEKQKALGDGKKTNAQIQKETAINLCEKDGFRQGLKVDKDKLKREKNVNSVEETLAKNVTEIMKEENNGEER